MISKNKDLTKPSVYGVGVFGIGQYECRDSNGKVTLAYSIWANMIKRCYTTYSTNKSQDAYKNATVDHHWHNFQNFAEWFYVKSKPYELNNIVPKLDKDLFGKDLYSTDTCTLLPNIINCSISERRKNSTHIHGVTKVNGKFQSTIMFKGVSVNLGRFSDLDSALTAYKLEKAMVMASLAEEYKQVLDERTYKLLSNWSN